MRGSRVGDKTTQICPHQVCVEAAAHGAVVLHEWFTLASSAILGSDILGRTKILEEEKGGRGEEKGEERGEEEMGGELEGEEGRRGGG